MGLPWTTQQNAAPVRRADSTGEGRPRRPRRASSGELDHEAFGRHPALDKVKRHLELNLGEPLSLRTAARIAGLNETYFSTLFHRRTGVRFREWVNRVRAERAATLIAHTATPIGEIARQVGYRDLRTFERAFRRRYATTARTYRARMRALGRRGAIAGR